LIEKFGICFDLEDDLVLTGDTMSIQSSQLSFNMRICKNGTGSCLADAEDKVNQAKEMTVTVGALEPYVDNKLKKDYWMYGLNTNTILSLDYIQTTVADIYLGKTEVETDYGWFVEMKEQETRGKIDRVRTEFSTKITLGHNTGNPDEFDTKFIRSDSLLYITFLASRNVVKISRSYDTLLDTFGSIGGSIDFFIFLITFFFHWYENINSNREIRGAVAEKMRIPPRYTPKQEFVCTKIARMLGLVKKKDRTDIDTEDALDQLTVEALSVERLTSDASVSAFLANNFYPKDVMALIPLAILIQQRNNVKAERQKNESEKEIKSKKTSDKNNVISWPNSPEQDKTKNLNDKCASPATNGYPVITEDRLLTEAPDSKDNSTPISLEDAYSSLQSPHDMFSPLRNELKRIIDQFCKDENTTPQKLFNFNANLSNATSEVKIRKEAILHLPKPAPEQDHGQIELELQPDAADSLSIPEEGIQGANKNVTKN